MNDIIVQFARLWGQREHIGFSQKDGDIATELRQYASDELLELLSQWAEEYQNSEIEDTVDFFEMKLNELVGV